MKIYGLPLIALAFTTLIACDAGAGPAAASTAAESAPAPSIDACRGCHAGPMGFAGKDSASVADALREIVAGRKAHPPVQLDDTSDAALEALAERLTAP